MTGQSLLDRMELLNQELQLQSGEENVVRGLVALNVAQDYFEAEAAQRPGILGGQIGTVTTTANTERTAFPTGLLRLDRLQMIGTNSLPKWDLRNVHKVGGHAPSANWPYSVLTSSASGEPTGYWTNGTYIYWSPLPNATHTVRWYGFQAVTDITASGTFLYPDVVALPLAAFAVRLYKSGIDDPVEDIGGLAAEAFRSVLDTLSKFNRDGAAGFLFTEGHDT